MSNSMILALPEDTHEGELYTTPNKTHCPRTRCVTVNMLRVRGYEPVLVNCSCALYRFKAAAEAFFAAYPEYEGYIAIKFSSARNHWLAHSDDYRAKTAA